MHHDANVIPAHLTEWSQLVQSTVVLHVHSCKLMGTCEPQHWNTLANLFTSESEHDVCSSRGASSALKQTIAAHCHCNVSTNALDSKPLQHAKLRHAS